MTQRMPLHTGWTVRAAQPSEEAPETVTAAEVPAEVPGCVHTDLLAAGLIPDPYLDANEESLAWIGRTDWTYATTFGWDGTDAERVDLCCDGLDTAAELSLNGVPLGTTRNMHRSYRFDVRDLLRVGENLLEITFVSAYTEAETVREKLGELPNSYPEPSNFIRKMACNFGWDWGPTLVTAGIWRPVRLEAWNTARLSRVRPLVTVDDPAGPATAGRVSVHADVEWSGHGTEQPLLLTARAGDTAVSYEVTPGETSAVLGLVVDEPALWWPRGYGEQPLYELEVSLATAGAGTALDTWQRRVGFRTVELDTTPDELGSRFAIVVNGEPVLVRGANWIPDDCFPTRVDRDRYAARIDQACAANMNLLRVWGGGLYESDDFYDHCDERGVLVWQDFLFACAAYPEESPIGEEVAAEAREAVDRLAPHPSLVLWNGNNENVMGWFDWDWQADIGARTWGRGYYLDVLPRIVAATDPTRPYWPGSPYSGSFDLHPQEDGHGTKHIWDVWNQRDYTGYRDHVPRFAAEFGFQGPPTYHTLRRSVSDTPLRPDSPGMLHHQKAEDGMGKLNRGLAHHFPQPATFTDWHYLTQVNQARALTLGVEHLRSHWPRCTGTVVWQLNDCWPVTSWAAVDSDGRPKPLWYALRRAYADRLVTVQPADERAGDPDGTGLVVALANDSGQQWSGAVRLVRCDLAGRLLAEAAVPFRAAPRSVARVAVPAQLAVAGQPAAELLTATVDGDRACWFFAEDGDIAYPEPRYDTAVSRRGDGYEVAVTAHTLLRELAIFADRLDPAARVDGMLVTLLPGESATFRVSTEHALDADALVCPPVLRCVNEAVRAARGSSDTAGRP